MSLLLWFNYYYYYSILIYIFYNLQTGKMGKYKKLSSSYFKLVNPLIIAMVGAAMYLMVVSAITHLI